MYTTSSVFLKILAEANITHAFVNWGSDHPALLEDLERQRVENGEAIPKIVTCPNEMVALSCAQGYAQVTGKPAAVFIHVDVGTQALGGAVHNVDRNRVPVLIYAGAAPFSFHGELPGSRNEFIFWLQDSLDQPNIVRQYMRLTAQINSGKNVNQVVMRALQTAQSDPPGPVYLWARREVMEQRLEEAEFAASSLNVRHWPPIEAATISPHAATTIAEALVKATKPFIVTSYLGRKPKAVTTLIKLSERLSIPVYFSCPSSVSFPMEHPHFVGISYGMGENRWLREADVILVLDSDIPWIPMHNKPRPDARIFHIDVDVLKQNMGMFHLDAELVAKADCTLALQAIIEALDDNRINAKLVQSRHQQLVDFHDGWIRELKDAEGNSSSFITIPQIVSTLGKLAPEKTLYLNEGISNYIPVWCHIRPSRLGSFFTSGASSLGWGLGAAIGAILGKSAIPGSNENNFVALIVGDGSFLFGVPSSAYWIARRYDTPFLTVILNNGGWRSPKLSMLGVHPSGMGSKAQSSQLNVTFGPESPDYSQIAVAAGGAWGRKITQPYEVEEAIKEAIRVVREERRCAVLDVVIEAL